MAKKSEPLIYLDLGSNGGEIKFRSVEEIESWVNREVTFWQWLQKCNSYDNFTGGIWNQLAMPWNQLNDKVNRLKSSPDDQEKTNNLNAIEGILNEYYKTGKSLHSTTPEAKRLLEYNRDETDQNAIITAAYMLGYFINAPFKINVNRPSSIAIVIKATQEAMFFKKGVTGISDSERAALNDLRETHTKLNNEIADQIEKTKEFQAATDIDFKTLHETLSEKFNTLYELSKQTLEDITNTYDKKLALQSAVKYWTDKAEKHRNLSIGFGIAFILTLLGVGFFGFKEIYPLLQNVSPNDKLEYWVVALIIISAVVGIWIVRLIVRVMLSHIHLQRDSSERATMLLTYLALLREGSGLKDDDKKLILQALFRPSASGIIKDDAIPPGIYDFITKPR